MAECLKMITVVHKGVSHKVPCGKCPFCLQAKQSSWMARLYWEHRNQEHPGWFLTLTYDEKHVKRVPGVGLSLRFRDVQLYLKRVRRAGYYCKYVCVGEYGSQTRRPHYHMLLWSDAPALELQRYWSDSVGRPLGVIHFGSLTMASCMYTLKYIINSKQQAYEGLERPRAQFSRGLGLSYLSTRVYEYHTRDYDDPVTTMRVDGRLVSLPRYYRNKIFTKYQMCRLAHKLYWDSVRSRRDFQRKLVRQGLTGVKAHVDALRREVAQQMIKSSVINLKL